MALEKNYKKNFGPDLPYCFTCTTFGQLLVVTIIIKIGATRCEILWLKRTKFDFCWGSAPDPAGELTTLPRPLAGLKEPTSKGRVGRGGKRTEGEGEVTGGEGKG